MSVLGQPTSVQVSNSSGGTIQASTVTYYHAADVGVLPGALDGAVYTVTTPKPGTTSSSPGTVTATYQYTSLGDISQVTFPGPNSTLGNTSTYTTVSYDYGANESLGEPLSVKVTGLGYDPGTNSVVSQTTTVASYTYDGRGNVLTVTDANGNTVSQQYNLANQPTITTYPYINPTSGLANDTTNRRYSWTGGPLLSVTTSGYGSSQPATFVSRTIDYHYGHEGELLSVSGDTYPVQYGYDSLYRTTSVAYEQGSSFLTPTYYFFDTVGNLFKVEYPDYTGTGLFDVESYGYDADGNVTSRTDGNGVVTDYLRDDGVYNGPGSTSTPDDRLLLVQYPSTPSENVQLGYDPFERVNSEQKGAGPYTTKAYSFDDLGLPLTATFGFANGPSGKGWTYAYNPDGSRSSMAYTNTIGTGTTYQYLYDALGRATREAGPWVGGGVNYQYFANGWLKQVNGSGFQTTYGYDSRDNLASLLNQWNNWPNSPTQLTTGSSFGGMTYDVMGNRLTESASIPSYSDGTVTVPNASHSRALAYDNLSELIGDTSTYTGGGGDGLHVGYSNSYQYDNAGNPTTFDGFGPNAFTADNQIQGTGFVYDGNGNPTTYSSSVAQGTTLGFDPENRLLSASGTSFADDYDPDGLRYYKTTGNGNRYFIHDGDSATLEIDSSGNVVHAYLVGPDGMREQYLPGASDYETYAFDPEGNLSQRQNGANTSSYAGQTSVYDAFGQLRGTLSDAASPPTTSEMVGFAGQWGGYTDIDQVNSAYSTGFVLMTHRFFDPKVGRFVNRDPIGYRGGINVYAYAGNNPITGIDPSGDRPLNANDLRHIGTLRNWFAKKDYDIIDETIHQKDLDNAIADLKQYIGSLKRTSPDPTNLKALYWAIDQTGSGWGEGHTANLPGFAPGTGAIQCNYFVASSYMIGAGVGRWPNGGFSLHLLKHYPVDAETLGDSNAAVNWLPSVSIVKSRPGDIVAFHCPARLGMDASTNGHATLKVGGNILIYAGGPGSVVKLNTLNEVKNAEGADDVTYRQYDYQYVTDFGY